MGDVPAGSRNGLEIDRRRGQRAGATGVPAAFGQVVLPEGAVTQSVWPERLVGIDLAESGRQTSKGPNQCCVFFAYQIVLKHKRKRFECCSYNPFYIVVNRSRVTSRRITLPCLTRRFWCVEASSNAHAVLFP